MAGEALKFLESYQAPYTPAFAPDTEEDSVLNVAKGVGNRLYDIVTLPKTLYDVGKEMYENPPSMPSASDIVTGAPGVLKHMVLGPNLSQAWDEGSWDPAFGTWTKAGETIFDILSGANLMPIAGAATKVGSLARAGRLGSRVQKIAKPLGEVADVATKAVIPKYMHTEATQMATARKQGQEFAGTVGFARPHMETTKGLEKTGVAGMVNPADQAAAAAAMAKASPAEQALASSVRGDIDKLWGDLRTRGLISQKKWASEAQEHLAAPRVPGEALSTRVGYTLDSLIKRIAIDNALTALKTEKAFDGRSLLSATKIADYEKLDPKLAGLKWKNTYLHPDITDAFPALDAAKTMGWMEKYVQLWKTGHVAWNPYTHINNLMGDGIMAILDGNSPFNPTNTKYFLSASKDVGMFAVNPNNLSPRLVTAMHDGVVLPSFASAEAGYQYAKIAPKTGASFMDHITDNVVSRFMLRAYDAEDQIFRYASYLKHIDKGMSSAEAALEVNKYFPNYHISSPVGRWARGESQHGALGPMIAGPFASFPLEMSRIYRNAATEHPVRYMVAASLPHTFTVIGALAQGMKPEQYQEMVRSLPDYQRGKVLVPFPSPDGGVMDWTNFFPLAGPTNLLGGLGGAMLELYTGKDMRTGAELFGPTADTADRVATVFGRLHPLPNALTSFWKRGEAADAGLPYRRSGSLDNPEKQPLLHSVLPMLESRPTEELAAAKAAQDRSRILGAKGAIKQDMRAPNLTPGVKERKKGAALEFLERYQR